MPRLTDTRGFTMIELLLAAMVSIIVIGAAFGVYITQHKHLLVQEQISDMQQNLRAGMDELALKIRMAGYNLPTGLAPQIASNTNPDTIEIIYDTGNLDNVRLEQAMPQPSAELRCDGHDLSGINDGDWLYIFDPVTKTGEYLYVTQVQYSSSHIQHNTMSLSKSYPLGSKILKINIVKYYIDRTSDTAHPKLMVSAMNQSPQIYSDNITNLQLQYVLSSGAIVDVPPLSTMVREVIINLTARTERKDDQFANLYRERVLETRVKVRNLGIQ